MNNLAEVLAFVNGQAEFHQAKCRQYAESAPRRLPQHEKISAQFEALAGFLQRQADYVDSLDRQLSQRPAVVLPKQVQLTLKLEDIENLPDELIRELSITDGDKADFAIQALMQERGGVMSLDQLLIGLYRRTGEVHKRSNLNARIYRMVTKGALYNVPGRKGVYSTQELTDDQAADLDRGATEPNS